MTNRIETNPKVMVGKPAIKGTRITVELILRQIAQGLTPQDILANYPHLKCRGYSGGDCLFSRRCLM